jgi:ATP-dependent helicase/nuclease subunit B
MSKATSKAFVVFSIAAGVPFVDALAQGVLDEAKGAQDLSATRVLLPTRRACRALRDAFLRRSGGAATLLPRMTALGEVDEDELALTTWDSDFGGSGDNDVPLAVSGLKRQLLLSRLIMALDRAGTTPDQAARLAVELARLLDQVHTERLSFDALAGLVPGAFAEHWRKTIKFLTILTEHWPKVLAEIEAVDPAARRNLLLEAQGRAWKANPPDFSVIAAGSTGSIPATADLLGVIAALPRGRVVLPGLDPALGEGAWKALKPSHPQYGLGRLLNHLRIQPGDVRPWPATGFAQAPSPRGALINAALRPAGHTLKDKPGGAALEGLERVDCAEPGQEAAAIALIMRQTLETPGRTCALVTPDRGLARRVAAELGRWRIEVDDSAGVPLAQTPPGAFLRLTARTVAEGFAPVGLLAALKHPLAAGGMAAAVFRGQVRALEATALRGPRPGPGLAGLKTAIEPKARRALADVLGCLEKAAGPFAALMRQKSAPFDELLAAHVRMAETLASGDEAASERLWAGDAGADAAAFIYELNESAGTLGEIAGNLYPALLDALMAGRVVRPRYGRHPRLFIWGLLEARLQQADTLILGGLNEGTWPPEAKANPWMSRPMLAAFGLPQPERRTGLTAHDFAQAFAAKRVIISRSTRVGGTPTVPSRWLMRLETYLKALGKDGALRPSGRWPAWALALDKPEKTSPLPAPEPRPPVPARPRKLSVTRIETWVRDPYALYAKKILKLNPTDPLDAEPSAARRGAIIHHALEKFHQAYPGDLPRDAVQKLIAIGGKELAGRLAPPSVRAFWWPQFIRIAEWFIENERKRRAAGYSIAGAETEGEMKIAAAAGPFILTARADRIDRMIDGSLAIIDFKTGQAPSGRQVKSGLAPQLSLEAALAEAGGFDGIAAAPAGELTVIRLTGGARPGEEKTLNLDAAEVAGTALAGLKKRIRQFDDPSTPYLSRRAPMFERYSGDYDHLARVKEWSVPGGNGGDGVDGE